MTKFELIHREGRVWLGGEVLSSDGIMIWSRGHHPNWVIEASKTPYRTRLVRLSYERRRWRYAPRETIGPVFSIREHLMLIFTNALIARLDRDERMVKSRIERILRRVASYGTDINSLEDSPVVIADMSTKTMQKLIADLKSGAFDAELV